MREKQANKPLEWTGLHMIMAHVVHTMPATQGQRYADQPPLQFQINSVNRR
jgi:hypothetical protein